LKRGSMRFWLCASAAAFLLAMILDAVAVKQAPKLASAKLANELTLARLRRGKSTIAKAGKLYPTVSYVRRIGDAKSKTYSLYGEPDSVSPSTKNGQPLELLYYAFDWAGPDVPQVMEVVCSAPKDGNAGRVVEITLAASSL